MKKKIRKIFVKIKWIFKHLWVWLCSFSWKNIRFVKRIRWIYYKIKWMFKRAWAWYCRFNWKSIRFQKIIRWVGSYLWENRHIIHDFCLMFIIFYMYCID